MGQVILRLMIRWVVLLVVGVIEAIVLFYAWIPIVLIAASEPWPPLSAWIRAPTVLGHGWELDLLYLGMPVGVAAATVAFLAPIAPPLQAADRPRTMRLSVIGAALIGAGLSFGVLIALLEVTLFLSWGCGVTMIFPSFGATVASVSAFIAIGWIGWTALLWRWGDRTNHSAAARLLRLILGGSIIELAIVIPAYAYARSRNSCFCMLGTFWALACGVGGLFFLAGPGALLLWYRQTGRWIRRDDTRWCARCGYDLTASQRTRCPECGHDWSASGAP